MGAAKPPKARSIGSEAMPSARDDYATVAGTKCTQTVTSGLTGVASYIANNNPFRYRGYYYDTETGFYYLNSRYYDPEVGRFLSVDDPGYLGVRGDLTSYNLYAYCGNSPILREDTGGEFWFVGIFINLAIEYAFDVFKNLSEGKTGLDILAPDLSPVGISEYVAATVTGAIPGTGVGSSILRNVASETITNVGSAIQGKDVDVGKSVISIATNVALDKGVRKLTEKTVRSIRAQGPRNYSSFAHEARAANSNLTKNDIVSMMQKSIKRINRCAAAVERGFDVVKDTTLKALKLFEK